MMQLVSCVHCRRTWQHTVGNRADKTIGRPIQQKGNYTHGTPCHHAHDVPVERPFDDNCINLFSEVPFIPTLQDTIDIEVIATLLRQRVVMPLQEDEAGEDEYALGPEFLETRAHDYISSFYYDLRDASESVVQVEDTPGGESTYLRETVPYKGQMIDHLSFFDRETRYYVFDLAHLGFISYIHRKHPTLFYEALAGWQGHEKILPPDERCDTCGGPSPQGTRYCPKCQHKHAESAQPLDCPHCGTPQSMYPTYNFESTWSSPYVCSLCHKDEQGMVYAEKPTDTAGGTMSWEEWGKNGHAVTQTVIGLTQIADTQSSERQREEE